ncbi:MAG: hypothetical protein AB7G21_09495 [Dehalococcoidia bacterium]
MRLRRTLLSLATVTLASALLACTPNAPATTAGPTVETAAGGDTYADRWQFPDQVAGFTRVDLERTGSGDSRQAIAGYNLDTRAVQIAITVYVYRAPAVEGPAGAPWFEAAERQFALEKAAILRAHGLSAQVPPSTAGSITAAGKEHPGLVAKFAFDEPFAGRVTAVDSHAYYFPEGEWAVKYRVSFPSAMRAQAEQRVAEFMAQLAWP